MELIKGIPVSPGIVFGRAIHVGEAERHVPQRTIAAGEVDSELRRLDKALEEAADELGQLRDRTERELGAEPAKIFGFHLGLLRDRALLDIIRGRIRDELVNAEQAVADQFQSLINQFRKMGNVVFEQKANDVVDLERRVLGKLMGETKSRIAQLKEPAVIIAHELTPSQTAGLDRAKVIAIATDAGGQTGHTSIVARALGLPAVVGCQDATERIDDGDLVLVDGDSGVLVVAPDEAMLAEYRTRAERGARRRRVVQEEASLDPVTRDGTRIAMLGNIEFPEEVEAVLANGGDGVGLFRTEFLYLTRSEPPDEEEQYRVYRRAIELLAGRPITIRTLDLGADKYTQEAMEEPERNPFLGLRSIRYCLADQPLFKTQLRAIMRASVHGPVKIMFPLVSTLMELRQAKMILADVCEELAEDGLTFDAGVRIGMMVEVPSAALMARVFASESDFFSIGTNDLVQYTLAVDRGNERVAGLYSAASPAILHLVKNVIRAARHEGIEVSLCGEIAGDPEFTMLLVGMGLRTLSMVPAQIPLVKRVVRQVNLEHCERLARRAGSFDSERPIQTFLRDELRRIDPETFGAYNGV
ncbi:MAG: phosphoenolpyruvate--protein phosphotransferase [Phycisphaeraceae bacterium]|nr:phosphoenolpyruvate--protein phosphotransferase [Phycisphaeraceae bacterium]